MKKFSVFLFALLATTSMYAWDFKYRGLYFTQGYSNTPGEWIHVAYVTNAGLANGSTWGDFRYRVQKRRKVIIPPVVVHKGVTYPVYGIASSAFEGCTPLSTVTIPNSVRVVGSRAFNGCTSLRSITLSDSIEWISCGAFERCTSLDSIIIPNSVTIIGASAFADCSSLKSVILPKGLKTIWKRTFFGCSSLDSITIPEGVTSIKHDAFCYCSSLKHVVIPNGTDSIEYGAFSYCRSLDSIVIPNTVTSIGSCKIKIDIIDELQRPTFANCHSLKSIVIEEGNPVYDSRENCNAIIETATNTLIQACQNTIIPEGVEAIRRNAFAGCFSLEHIAIPTSLDSLGWNTFADCSSLKSIVVKKGNPVYDSRENCNAIIETATNTLVQACQNTIIPASVTRIGAFAFHNCDSITTITLPEGVIEIEGYAFTGCDSLASISIPHSVTRIHLDAFPLYQSLTIHYNGTVAEWKRIYQKGSDRSAISDFFTSKMEATSHCICTDGEVDL